MTNSWADFETAEPDFAEGVRDRFGKYTHHVLGTLRRDGSPRLTGIEVTFRFGELWLGMMPNSRKALDLRRDPRFAVHANPGSGTSMADGDVRVGGRAVEVTDPEVRVRFQEAVEAPEPFHLFRAELTEIARVGVEGDELVVQAWQPGRGLRTVRRR
ncbi:pyridoxamine 5'-phosphate oxidase family protein [Streptomyces formicae]|uniref:Pyridoxamine 5'-phosphate oxidase family protein n=1 Tax=Streptomyces formicae TaxID=1616117 RepID=A0ABY3WVI3_9ACTN|nr:pyridoxamine 5'-phosphate oxidase family protein [Streptomyces formicae]UNM14496.1 pyridoxamine 5'-phosphate oxidase family protein [Streptomyces formicae]